MPKNWLRSLALRRKGVNISNDKAIRRRSKEQFDTRLYAVAFTLYFDDASVAERTLKWLGFSSRHVVTLMF